jgi:hypothetical protein
MTDRTTKALLAGILLAIVLHAFASAQAANRDVVMRVELGRIAASLDQTTNHSIAMMALLNQIEIDACMQAHKALHRDATFADAASQCPSRPGPAWTSEASWRAVADK